VVSQAVKAIGEIRRRTIRQVRMIVKVALGADGGCEPWQ
jgi:hypothetical protein